MPEAADEHDGQAERQRHGELLREGIPRHSQRQGERQQRGKSQELRHRFLQRALDEQCEAQRVENEFYFKRPGRPVDVPDAEKALDHGDVQQRLPTRQVEVCGEHRHAY